MKLFFRGAEEYDVEHINREVFFRGPLIACYYDENSNLQYVKPHKYRNTPRKFLLNDLQLLRLEWYTNIYETKKFYIVASSTKNKFLFEEKYDLEIMKYDCFIAIVFKETKTFIRFDKYFFGDENLLRELKDKSSSHSALSRILSERGMTFFPKSFLENPHPEKGFKKVLPSCYYKKISSIVSISSIYSKGIALIVKNSENVIFKIFVEKNILMMAYDKDSFLTINRKMYFSAKENLKGDTLYYLVKRKGESLEKKFLLKKNCPLTSLEEEVLFLSKFSFERFYLIIGELFHNVSKKDNFHIFLASKDDVKEEKNISYFLESCFRLSLKIFLKNKRINRKYIKVRDPKLEPCFIITSQNSSNLFVYVLQCPRYIGRETTFIVDIENRKMWFLESNNSCIVKDIKVEKINECISEITTEYQDTKGNGKSNKIFWTEKRNKYLDRNITPKRKEYSSDFEKEDNMKSISLGLLLENVDEDAIEIYFLILKEF